MVDDKQKNIRQLLLTLGRSVLTLGLSKCWTPNPQVIYGQRLRMVRGGVDVS